jgi:hypothetical protein
MAEGEHRGNANVALAAVASARSSMFGRGPTMKDVDLAAVLLGYDAAGLPDETVADLARNRLVWFAAASHHPEKLSGFLAAIDAGTLQLTADEARNRMAQGEQLIIP